MIAFTDLPMSAHVIVACIDAAEVRLVDAVAC